VRDTIEISVPDEAGCLALLRKYNTPEHIISHSRMVWAVGKLLADGLLKKGFLIDLKLLRASCLLHDIAKYPCIVDKSGWHDEKGEEMLRKEGLPLVGSIVLQHVLLRGDSNDDIGEPHLLNYSDKRVVHDRVTSLDERFTYLAQTYGKTPRALERLEVMKKATFRLERRIFRHLDFLPEDVPDLIVKPEG
jgi:uncharacterized protein